MAGFLLWDFSIQKEENRGKSMTFQLIMGSLNKPNGGGFLLWKEKMLVALSGFWAPWFPESGNNTGEHLAPTLQRLGLILAGWKQNLWPPPLPFSSPSQGQVPREAIETCEFWAFDNAWEDNYSLYRDLELTRHFNLSLASTKSVNMWDK